MTAEENCRAKVTYRNKPQAVHLEAYCEALFSIAALSDGDEVTSGFDEPYSARIAREALTKHWIGPCVHGRDPWDRCDEACELVPDEVAWAWAQRASNPKWRAQDEERQRRLMEARHG